jgi:hypothetical protein
VEIKRKYLHKYLHELAIEQLSDEYRQNGYAVSTSEKLGSYETDFIARRSDEVIVIEIKTGRLTPERRKQIAALADYVRSIKKGYKFFAVVATPPKEKKLEIDNLSTLLTSYLIEHLPNELDELSTHTRIESVSDIDIDELTIEGDKVYVVGDGAIDVELQIGSDGDVRTDYGFVSHESFPFTFSIVLGFTRELKLEVEEFEELEIDTSSLYE